MLPSENAPERQPPSRTPSGEADKDPQAPQRPAEPTTTAGRTESAAAQQRETGSSRDDIKAPEGRAKTATVTDGESEPAIPVGETPRRDEAEVRTPDPEEPPPAVTISDVWVRQEGLPPARLAAIEPHTKFTVQIHFRLQGPRARALTMHKSPFEARVYAEDLTTGARRLLAVESASLVESRLDYQVEMPSSGLSSGQHRLLTLVAIHTPINMIDHHYGPLLSVAAE
jgi:hypothetical protein